MGTRAALEGVRGRSLTGVRGRALAGSRSRALAGVRGRTLAGVRGRARACVLGRALTVVTALYQNSGLGNVSWCKHTRSLTLVMRGSCLLADVHATTVNEAKV